MSDLLVFEYQPTDENDRPIGAKQVFKYTDTDNLRDQLVQSNLHLVRKLRQVTKENRLSVFQQEKPAEAAPMTDEDVRTSLFALRAERAAENFVRLTPEYYKCQENVESIFSWIVKNGLSPIETESYMLAFEDLSKDDLLVLGPAAPKPIPVPVVAPVAITAPLEEVTLEEPVNIPQIDRVVETIPGYAPEPPKSEQRATPGAGGLNRNVADAGGYKPSSVSSDVTYTLYQKSYNDKNELIVTGQTVLYGKQALDAMPQEEYKRRLTKEPGFAAKVDKIEKEATEVKLAARRAAMGRF